MTNVLTGTSDKDQLKNACDAGMLKSLAGNRIVLTGTMSLSRADMVLLIRALGGDVPASVTRQTTILVTADSQSLSQKVQDAQRLGTVIMTEEEFVNALTP